MRIGLVIDYFDPLRGGQERWTARFASALLQRGHEVHVLAREFAASTDDLAVTRHTIAAWSSRQFCRRTEQRLADLALDIVHDTGSGWTCDVFNPRYGSRATAVREKVALLPPILRPFKRAMIAVLPRYRAFDAIARRQYVDDGRLIVAVSQRVARQMVDDYHVAPERIRVVYNGVDVAKFAEDVLAPMRAPARAKLGLAGDTLALLLVANNFQLKGVPTLLKAMTRLRGYGPPLHAIVVGHHRQAPPMKRLAERVGLADRVTFTGRVDDARPYFAAADVLVYPTTADACANVPMEGMAAGLPVVTSNRAGSHELITPGVDGHVIDDPTSCEAFAVAIAGLFDESVRRKIGASARATITPYTHDRNTDAMLAVYEEILRRRGPG